MNPPATLDRPADGACIPEPEPETDTYPSDDGRDRPPARKLHCGPVTAELRTDRLVNVRVRGIEVLRELRFVIIDADGRSSPPGATKIRVSQREDSFTADCHAHYQVHGQTHSMRIRFSGGRDGSLTCTSSGFPDDLRPVPWVGFLARLPLTSLAGQTVTACTSAGITTPLRVPASVGETDLMARLRSITHQITTGTAVTLAMSGASFDLVDGRTNAEAGFFIRTRQSDSDGAHRSTGRRDVRQTFTLSLSRRRGQAAIARLPRRRTQQAASTLQITLGSLCRARLPSVALRIEPCDIARALAALEAVELAHPSRLVGRYDTRRGHGVQTFTGYRQLMERTGLPLTLELVASSTERHAWELAMLAREMAEVGLKPEAIVAISSEGGKPGHTTTLQTIAPAELLVSARQAFPDARIGLQVAGEQSANLRNVTMATPPDFIVMRTPPAGSDEIRQREALELLPSRLASVLHHAGTANCHTEVLPPSLGQGNLNYGAWLGSVIATVAHLPVPEIVVPSAGVMFPVASGVAARVASVDSSRLETAQAGDHACFTPAYHVLGAMARAGGARRVGVSVTDTLRVQCLAWRQGRGTVIWLTNPTDGEQELELNGLGAGPHHYGMITSGNGHETLAGAMAFQRTRRVLPHKHITLPPRAIFFVGTA